LTGELTPALAAKTSDSISLQRLKKDINGLFGAFPQFDAATVGQAEQWPHFDELLLSILADLELQAGNTHQFLAKLKVESKNTRFDTLVITPRTGQAIRAPLTR
jgi:hypothetical protein